MAIEEIIEQEAERILEENVPEPARRAMRKVKGLAKKRRKSPFKKFADVFFEEALSTVKQSLITEVIIPTIKDFLADIFIGGVERTLYGSGSSRSKRSRKVSNSLVPVTSYNAYYNSDRKRLTTKDKKEKKEDIETFTFEDIVLRDRASAKDFLDDINARIVEYGNISIAEVYEALDEELVSVNFSENDYGWDKVLPNEIIVRVPNGFWLNLPKPVQLVK